MNIFIELLLFLELNFKIQQKSKTCQEFLFNIYKVDFGINQKYN